MARRRSALPVRPARKQESGLDARGVRRHKLVEQSLCGIIRHAKVAGHPLVGDYLRGQRGAMALVASQREGALHRTHDSALKTRRSTSRPFPGCTIRVLQRALAWRPSQTVSSSSFRIGSTATDIVTAAQSRANQDDSRRIKSNDQVAKVAVLRTPAPAQITTAMQRLLMKSAHRLP